MASDPDISGLNKMGAIGNRTTFRTDNVEDASMTGDFYNCRGGESEIIPDEICPSPIDPGFTGFSESFTIPAHWETHTGSGVYADELYPPPDLALVEVEMGFRFGAYTEDCRVDDPDECGDRWGCVFPSTVDVPSITVEFAAPIGGGSVDWNPSGITPWNSDAWTPGQDPGYYDTFNQFCELAPAWDQSGTALIAPPATIYTDPDPMDTPGVLFAPFLWRWRDLIGADFSIDVPGLWHSIAPIAAGTAWLLTVTPYRYITPPVTSGRTVYWL